jgi:4-amino-4-deoxy-L-arabinose transferase-like glycosyltransferase
VNVLDRLRVILTAAVLIYFLYFFGLTAAGLVGPDEPRYAAIGREMARSGDWITPVLWGQAWFEKPPLLYWMTAAAHRAGLGPDLAPRLPVAVLSVVFLCVFWRLTRGEFGPQIAFYSTAVLATSAGWAAFSHLALPDLPLAATFTLAMLLGLRWVSTNRRAYLLGAWLCLGLSVLAKGLVPLMLLLPFLWYARDRLPAFFHPAAVGVFLLTAAPWYVLCAMRHGSEFLAEFFWRHHLERFAGGDIHHPRPFWFYLPILPAAIFPWTPWLLPLLRPNFYRDSRRRFLGLWVLFGLLFFSASVNKLPGYLLPLLPALALLAAMAMVEIRDARLLLAATLALLLLVPLISRTLAPALAVGLSRAPIGGWQWPFAIAIGSLGGLVWLLEQTGRRRAAVLLAVTATTLGMVFLKVQALPEVDRWASARPLWEQVGSRSGAACVETIHRNWKYGLDYYAGTPLPPCADATERTVRIGQLAGRPPFVRDANGR